MTPPTVNAYANGSFNEIVFPAGILQPPRFDLAADDASNYGAVGSVIGHEMTHHFDDEGRKYDADGNLKDWWTPADEKAFTARAEAIARQYDGYVSVDTMHVNGHLTLGENIADLGGLTVAYYAFEKSLEGKPRPANIDGFTPEQRFFIAFAQSWRAKIRPELLRTTTRTDPHSPAFWRVNGVVVNMPEFQKAFGCPDGAPLAPVKRNTIW
jgi:putative endopeptidase